ncbi:MAG: hypothetical protein A4E53_03375 [Pelotomaculum sp. PtaB.Bin104]|nr:MAG: hypothetical protein A4E53_03375 [Pelotomaculum sp. PtaB.Bin104]
MNQMVIVTERDKKALRFMAKWRFCTLDQLIKVGIFLTSRKKAYNRLLSLRRANLVNSYRLSCGQVYYYLAPKGGEVIDLPNMWHSKIYRNAGMDTVVKSLITCDFALAMGIDYLPRQEVLNCFIEANYSLLEKCLRSSDLFYEKGGALNVLVIDYQYSFKYLAEKLKLYSRLPLEIRDKVTVNFLLFDETRQKQILRVAKDFRIRVKALKANWKY